MEMFRIKKGEWLCYRGGLFNGGGNGHVREVASLMEGEWSCYRVGVFNERGMVMLQRWPV